VPTAQQLDADAEPRSNASIAAALRRRLPRDAAYTVVFNTAVAALLTLGGRNDFWTNFVYSQSIGLGLLLLIDGGRLVLWPGRRPSVVPMIGLSALSVPVAVVGGGLLAGALLGTGAGWARIDAIWGSLAIAVAGAAFGTYFFWTRERSAHIAAEAAAGRLRGAELERQAAEARFRQLAAQIEPHFLFNTLANLRALIETDPPRAVAMLDHLDGYLRASLAASRTARVPLAEECALLRSYLEIVAVRMGPRLAWRIDIPGDLAGVSVPPMLLQPLVENAVKHGLEPNPSGGEVTVSARRDGTALVVEVADTGLGLGGATEGTGFGVASVRERLAAAYGEAASFTLEPGVRAGVRATMRLPIGAAA